MELTNSITKQWVEAYIKRPKATLMISTNNDNSSGILVANYIYEKIRNSTKIPLYKLEITDKKSLGIEDIRDIQNNLSLKASINGDYTRFVLISEAEKLTTEAQNALLKLVEELPDKTILMLVVNDESAILQTVFSRCFKINILPIAEADAVNYARNNNFTDNQIKKAYLISEGNSTIFQNLLEESNDSVEEVIHLAKNYIKSNVHERQIILEKLNKMEIPIIEFIQLLKLTARTGMRHAKELSSKNQWKSILSKIILAEEQLQSNVQTKLVMLALSVSI